ncbi:unnamed protein product [Bemisia tabaci]|uniref:Uncharacterized protein n=1 Tax=Bemisia tabaci TaxID=7038 RepID=A0A9P0AQH3_BEMTA|nr:unnamed protein product [Bemisia tabaci]
MSGLRGVLSGIRARWQRCFRGWNPSFYVMKLTTDPVVADPKDMKQEMRRLLTKIRALKMQLLQLNALAQEYGNTFICGD